MPLVQEQGERPRQKREFIANQGSRRLAFGSAQEMYRPIRGDDEEPFILWVKEGAMGRWWLFVAWQSDGIQAST